MYIAYAILLMHVELCFYIRISYDTILGDLICEFLEDGDGNTN